MLEKEICSTSPRPDIVASSKGRSDAGCWCRPWRSRATVRQADCTRPRRARVTLERVARPSAPAVAPTRAVEAIGTTAAASRGVRSGRDRRTRARGPCVAISSLPLQLQPADLGGGGVDGTVVLAGRSDTDSLPTTFPETRQGKPLPELNPFCYMPSGRHIIFP